MGSSHHKSCESVMLNFGAQVCSSGAQVCTSWKVIKSGGVIKTGVIEGAQKWRSSEV